MGESLRGVAVGATGLVLGILAAASIPLLNWIIHKEVTKRVVIQNNTESELFPIWADPSLLPEFYLQIYPFHVKNPEAASKGEKAVVEQRGPYTYREYRRKENIMFNDNGTVSYIERRWYKFMPDMSAGWDNDTFTTLNIPLVALANAVRYDRGAYQWIVSELIKAFPDEKLFVTKTVKDMVFGYEDRMLSWAKYLRPSQFYTDIVGILAGKNYSYDGEYTIFTGENDINKLGKIDKFNGSSYLSFWTTDYANMINGSDDGSVFPPFISKNFSAYFFSTDICRAAVAIYHSDVEVTKYKVKAHRYRAPKKELEKPSLNPDNAGFCTPYGNCMGSGVLNISTCQKIDGFHIPIVISFPHFFMAEDQYVNGVIGMNPTSDLVTEVDIEPTTGLVMQAFKKIQMNLYLQNSSSFTELEKVRNTVFPILWVNESIRIDNKHAAMIKHELLIPQMAVQIVQYIVIGIGALLLLIGTFLVARSGIKKRARRSESEASVSSGQIQHPDTTSLPTPNGGVNGAVPADTGADGDVPGESVKVPAAADEDVPADAGAGSGDPNNTTAVDKDVPTSTTEVDQGESNVTKVDSKAAGDNEDTTTTVENPEDDTDIDVDDTKPLMPK